MKTLLVLAFTLASGVAMAQSVGNAGNPAAADTTDPNSAPLASPKGAAKSTTRSTTGSGRLDAAGRANTSDPNSARSGATNAAGRPVDPTANPKRR